MCRERLIQLGVDREAACLLLRVTAAVMGCQALAAACVQAIAANFEWICESCPDELFDLGRSEFIAILKVRFHEIIAILKVRSYETIAVMKYDFLSFIWVRASFQPMQTWMACGSILIICKCL